MSAPSVSRTFPEWVTVPNEADLVAKAVAAQHGRHHGD
jgi:hypothetical protein